MQRHDNGTRDTIEPPLGATDPGVREVERAEELRDASLADDEERAFPQQGEARAQAGLRNFVVQRPLVAIAGAVAAGFILGRILSR